MWALHIPDLTVVPGYPVLIQGPASNDPTKYFNGGEILQRPGLTMIGDSIIAGFGGHCDSMNYVNCPLSLPILLWWRYSLSLSLLGISCVL